MEPSHPLIRWRGLTLAHICAHQHTLFSTLHCPSAVPVDCYEYDDNAHALGEAFADGDVWVNSIVWLKKYVAQGGRCMVGGKRED